MSTIPNTQYLHQQDGNLTYKQVKKLFTKQDGAGINFKFRHGPDYDNPKHFDEHCILFSNLLDHPLEMMFLVSNRQGGAIMTQIKRAILNHKYVFTSNCLLYFLHVSFIFILIHYIAGFNIYRYVVRMGAATHIYRDEVFGGKVALVALCLVYDKQVIIKKHDTTLAIYREQPIYDQRIQNHIELAADNEGFMAFHTFVNGQCQ